MKRSLPIALSSAAILWGACHSAKTTGNSTNNASTDSNITGRKWRLTEICGKPVAEIINGKIPFILLQDTGSSYSASAGCNGLGGRFTLSGNGRIKFSQGMSTMMACDNMEVETRFKKVLEQTDNYTVNGNTLSFNKARMAPIARFEAEEN